MRLKQHIPNLITLGNLLGGVIAICLTAMGEYQLIPFAIGFSLVADFLDGLIARLLGVNSELGAQLDSLSDMVSFGVLPAFLLYTVNLNAILLDSGFIYDKLGAFAPLIVSLPCFLYPLAAAYRLGKFNLLENQSGDFSGLPTPAAAMAVFGFCFYILIGQEYELFSAGFYFFLVSGGMAILLSILMISNLHMFSLKLHGFGLRENWLAYSSIIVSIALLLICKFAALTIIVSLYIILSIIRNLVNTKDEVRS